MRCVGCGDTRFSKAGFNQRGQQVYRCTACRCRQTARSLSAFSGYRFPDDIIALAVRWYLRFRLPYAVMWTFAETTSPSRDTRRGKEVILCMSTALAVMGGWTSRSSMMPVSPSPSSPPSCAT